MNLTATELLALLLKQEPENNLAERCCNALIEKASASIISTGSLPIDHVRRIYGVRAETNNENVGAVEGYDELIRSLDEEKDETINIHSFEAEGKAFTVFTNESCTKLLGLLISRKTLRPAT